MSVKRLRVFAGPNGSGKSTLVKFITSNFHIPFGYFVNADNIERELSDSGAFDFTPCGLQVDEQQFRDFASASSFNEKVDYPLWNSQSILTNNSLSIPSENFNSYHAALIADFIRESMLGAGISFTFETVLSDERKLGFLQRAKERGYRIYLYYVATENVEINISRVHNRVLNGGHDVPVDKIMGRYNRSLSLLPRIIQLTDRAFLFDNSQSLRFVAEISEGNKLSTVKRPIPVWLGKILG